MSELRERVAEAIYDAYVTGLSFMGNTDWRPWENIGDARDVWYAEADRILALLPEERRDRPTDTGAE